MNDRREKLPKYIKLFIALYPILPTYFAVNISNSMPLISASRMLLVFVAFITVVKNKHISRIVLPENRGVAHRIKYLLYFYACTQIVVSLLHLTGSAINNIFCLIFENFVLLFCLAPWMNTKERIDEALKIIVVVSGIVCLLAITEPFTKINLAYFLDTAHRSTILKAGYSRGGILRAEFTFGHPIALGMYILLVFPFTMYFYGKTKQIRFYIIALLNIFASILSSSRSPMAILAGMFVVSIWISDKKTRKAYLKLAMAGICGTIVLLSFSTSFLNVIIYNVQEMLAVVGLGPVTDNLNSISVRATQWSVLDNVIHNNLIFGAGIGYIRDNIIYYINSNGNIGVMKSVDCEYLEQIIEGGIIGLVGFISLVITFLYYPLRKKFRKRSKLFVIFFISFFGYFLGYVTVSELKDQMLWVMFTLFYALIVILPSNGDCCTKVEQ